MDNNNDNAPMSSTQPKRTRQPTLAHFLEYSQYPYPGFLSESAPQSFPTFFHVRCPDTNKTLCRCPRATPTVANLPAVTVMEVAVREIHRRRRTDRERFRAAPRPQQLTLRPCPVPVSQKVCECCFRVNSNWWKLSDGFYCRDCACALDASQRKETSDNGKESTDTSKEERAKGGKSPSRALRHSEKKTKLA